MTARYIIENATEDLTEVSQWWPEVLDDMIPGTRRRWHQRTFTAAEKIARDARDHEERLARFGVNSTLPTHLKPRVTTPPGESPSPGRDDVLDIIADVTWTIIDLRDAIAATFNAGRRRLPVPEACSWIISTLPELPGRPDPSGRHPDLLERTAFDARRLTKQVRTATGRTEDVIELDAACPNCAQPTLHAYAQQMKVVCHHEECMYVWVEQHLLLLAQQIGADIEAVS